MLALTLEHHHLLGFDVKWQGNECGKEVINSLTFLLCMESAGFFVWLVLSGCLVGFVWFSE